MLSAALERSGQIEFTSFQSAQNQGQLAEVMITTKGTATSNEGCFYDLPQYYEA